MALSKGDVAVEGTICARNRPLTSILLRLINLSRNRKRLLKAGVDAALLPVVFSLSMWLRLDSLAFITLPQVWLAMLPVVPLSLLLFVGLGFYQAVTRYISARALTTILFGAVASGTILAVVVALADLPIPRSVPLIYTVLTFLSLGGIRFSFRELVSSSQNGDKKRLLIYGAGAAGRQLLQILRQGAEYLPIAFIDDNVQTHGTFIGGLRVHGPDQVDQLIESFGIEAVLLAIPSASKLRRSEILKSLEHNPVHLRTVPGLEDILSGKARLDDLNEIGIEDLLGRDPIEPQANLMSANIRNKVVMVTGAGGSIGSELCRQILRQSPRSIILFELSELALYTIEQELIAYKNSHGLRTEVCAVLGSVQSRTKVEQVLIEYGVETVYHAAAYKHVPLVEHNVVEGIRNNVFGTMVVAEAAIVVGVESFILISTDKAVRPTNVMGASKRLAEMICQSLAKAPHNSRTVLSMVRFGNVLGSSGSVIPLFQRQISAGGPLTVTHRDITRFFMTIPEAAQLVIQAGAMAQGGDVFVLDMGEPVRISDLASQMVRLHGLKPVLFSKGQPVKTKPDEIGIVFTQLRPGEKLFEELLISNNPQLTAHPQIMTATELCRDPDELATTLAQLTEACDTTDIARIRALLIEAKTGYVPQLPDPIDDDLTFAKSV